MNRRKLLQMTGLLAATGAVSSLTVKAGNIPTAGPRVHDVRTHGAQGDGKTLDTKAINEAVNACNDSGGGVVYVGPGTYLSGTVVLKSNVTLYLEAGATLLGSAKTEDYQAQTGPNLNSDAGQRHLIFARDAENVGLAGPGRIDGQGPKFWVPSQRTPLPPEEAWRDVATYDWKPLARVSPLLEFYNCRNLRIEDVRIENASGWTLRPIQCNNVFIRGVTIKNPVIGPNTDGLDLTCSQNVFVSDCMIDTGDDAICLKSENPYSQEVPVSRNITITNCVLSCCCNGLKFGTATHGGFENITFSNSIIFNDNVPLGARVIAGLALEVVDGGWIDGVVVSNIRMQRTRTPIFIRRGLRRERADGSAGTLRGVMIENVYATGSILTSSITGLPGNNVEDVTLSNIRIDSDEGGKADWVERPIPENPKSYPEARMFGRLPAAGLYVRHVRGLRAHDVEFKMAPAEERPAVLLDDVRDVEIRGLRSTAITGTQPVVKLIQSREVTLRGCTAPPETRVYLEVHGSQCEHVLLVQSDLTYAQRPTRQAADVPYGAVIVAGNTRKPAGM
jgi:polygalacturonase